MSLTVQLALGVLLVMATIGAIVWRSAAAFDKAFPSSKRARLDETSGDGDIEGRTASG